MAATGTYRAACAVILMMIYNKGEKVYLRIESIPGIVERLEKVEKALIAKGIMTAALPENVATTRDSIIE